MSFIGHGGADDVDINVPRNTDSAASQYVYTGQLTVATGDGNDVITYAKLKNGDSIDLGAGDDSISFQINNGNGTEFDTLSQFGSASFAKLDGGTGSDTLIFSHVESDVELTLTLGGATNFENITGNSNAEVIKGDNNNNVLLGNGGADTLYGYGGNDTLNAGSGSTNDILYGGSGNDTLVGSDGDNTFDGGTGADIITTGSGSDTIVLRSGDGGSTLAEADTITDFTDGNDVLGLDDDLQYTDLTITQGTGSNSSDTIISAGSEYLAILTGINVSDVTEADFTPVDIA